MRLRLAARLLSLAIATLGGGSALAWEDISSGGACGFGQTFDGPGSTTFVVSQSEEAFEYDFLIVSFSNDNWSIAEGDKLDDQITIESEHSSIFNKALTGDNAIRIPFRYKVFADFADERPTSVKLYKGKQEIDALNFSGFSLSWAKFTMCRYKWEKAKQERERLQSLERLPKDPFAKPTQ